MSMALHPKQIVNLVFDELLTLSEFRGRPVSCLVSVATPLWCLCGVFAVCSLVELAEEAEWSVG